MLLLTLRSGVTPGIAWGTRSQRLNRELPVCKRSTLSAAVSVQLQYRSCKDGRTESERDSVGGMTLGSYMEDGSS